MSTIAAIERMPLRSSRCFIHAGVGALAFTFSITRLAKRGQPCVSSTRTRCVALLPARTGVDAGAMSSVCVIADTSRATPRIDRQSARLGVSLSVSSVSSSASASLSGVPGASDSSRTRRPDASSSSPSSFAEHNMPCDKTPRTDDSAIAVPFGSIAPGRASGAYMPTAAFGAPQTTLTGDPLPASTLHTRRRSAFGCASTLAMRATTTLSSAGPAGSRASTSSPAIVSASARTGESIAGFAIVRSQFSENFIGRLSSELAQEAQVVLVEQAKVVHAVAKHCKPVGSHAERDALPALRIDADGFQYVRMHLARARDLEPSFAEAHVDLGRRLGEREERRAKPHAEVVALEEAAQEFGEHALQVGERHVLADPQAFDLVEHRRMRRVAVDTIHAARRDDLDRRLVRLHPAHLHR